jgi:signal transduction histidine kinase
MGQSGAFDVVVVESNARDATRIVGAITASIDGAQCHVVPSACAFRDLLDSIVPDLVVVEHDLLCADGCTGFDVLETLRERGLAAATLMLTATGSETVAVRALHSGFDHYAPKAPFDEARLMDEIARALTLHDARDPQGDAARGRDVRAIVHEISNPLAGIKSAIRVVRSSFADDDPGREIVDLVEKEIDRLTQIARSLLEPRTHDSSGIAGRDVTIELTDLVRSIEVLFRPLFRSADVHLDGESEEGIVLIDEARVRQIVYNLLKNGLESCSPGGHVRLSGAFVGGDLCVSVTDDGPGVAPEHLNKLFDPTFSTKARGRGRGLHICRALARSMGGDIEVECRPSQAIFRLRLPRARAMES